MPDHEIVKIYAGDNITKVVSTSVPLSGMTARMQVRPYPQSDLVVFEVPITADETASTVTWSLSALATSAMSTYKSVIDEYSADIQISNGLANTTTIKSYLFKVQPDITRGDTGPPDPGVIKKEITDLQTQVKALIAKVANIKIDFAGIHQTEKELTDAVPNPAPDQQAIVLQPSEYYYHVVGGKWVQLAPVGDIHPGYIGAYDNLADLKLANPNPKENSLAIIGGNDFYYFTGGKWVALTHDDVTALNARVTKVESALTALQNKLNSLDGIVKVSLDGRTMTFEHADGAKHSILLPVPTSGPTKPSTQLEGEIRALEQQMTNSGIDINKLKQQYGQLSHRIDTITGVYSYVGSGLPDYPDDAKHTYFITSKDSGARQINIPVPNPTNGPLEDGTMLYYNNESNIAKVVLQPDTGQSIDNGTHLDIPPNTFAILILNGTKWTTISKGYIPSSEQDMINRVANDLHTNDQLHTTKDITDLFNQLLANPHTKGILDHIMSSLGYTKSGGGNHPQDQPIVHFGTIATNTYPADFTSEIGHYGTHIPLIANGLDVTPKFVWLAIPQSLSSKLSGIVANGGMPAQWSSKTITVDGNQWDVYLSPTKIYDAHLKLTLNWSI